LYVRDENNCLRTINVNLNVLKDATVNLKAPTCFGRNNGTITLFPENGTGPFTYRLNDGVFGTTNMWSGLVAGEYTYAIADNKRDTIRGTVMLTQPDSLQMVVEIMGNDLKIIASGGTPGYIYSLDGGVIFLDNSEFLDLEAGGYNVVVRDKNGCLTSQEIVIVSTNNLLNDPGIRITPNPATDQLTIHWLDENQGAGFMDIQIFTSSGQLWEKVKVNRAGNEPLVLPVDAWPSGVYIMQLSGQASFSMIKVVKM
jgi:hypothetical protein